MIQQKSRFLTNLSQFLLKPRKLFKNGTSIDLSVETIGYSNAIWEKVV